MALLQPSNVHTPSGRAGSRRSSVQTRAPRTRCVIKAQSAVLTAPAPAAAKASAPPAAPAATVPGAVSPAALEQTLALRRLQQRTQATLNLLQLRDARLATLTSFLRETGLPRPKAAVIAAASAAGAAAELERLQVELAGARASGSMSSVTAAMGQLNAVLMLQCRSKNTQIQLIEAALRNAHIRVPCLRLAHRSSDGGSPDGGSSSSSSSRRDAAVTAAIAASEAAAAVAAVATPDAASAAEPAQELLKVRINVTCVTQPGDQLYLAGDHPMLGGWQPDAGSALRMQPAGRNVWQAELEVPAAAAAAAAAAPAVAQRGSEGLMMLCFKALLKRANGTLQWQPGGSRKLLLGRELHHHLQPCVANMAFHELAYDDTPLNYRELCSLGSPC